MKRIEKGAQYLLLVFSTIIALLILDFIFMGVVLFSSRKNIDFGNQILSTSSELSFSGDSITMSDEGKRMLDQSENFAMLISKDGRVIWDYNKPEDVPTIYSINDVAVFTKWYLNDYPVSVRTMSEGLFVVGYPKNTVWKYNLSNEMTTMTKLIKLFPFGLLFNIMTIVFVPLFLSTRWSKKAEYHRTEWIAGVSHDIRTPLSLALLNTKKLTGSNMSEEVRTISNNILQQELRIKSLVENLNTDNKLSFGYGSWKKEEIVLARIIRDIMCDYMNQEENNIYDFECDIDDTLENYFIYTDEGLLKRLLDNLIVNSIRHNPDGCTIKVELKQDKKNHKCHLNISDTGIGVSEETLKMLNHKLNNDKLPEHGLGLRVVKQIVKKNGWKILFETNPDITKDSAKNGFLCKIEIR